MVTIGDSLQAELMRVLETTSVFPNYIPRVDDQWLGVPAATYRQLDGERMTHGDVGLSKIVQDKFLVEVFSYNIEEARQWSSRLFDSFTGPIGRDDAPGHTRWVEDGPVIHWAEAASPSSDLEAAAYEHHQVLVFEQLVITVTYLRSC